MKKNKNTTRALSDGRVVRLIDKDSGEQFSLTSYPTHVMKEVGLREGIRDGYKVEIVGFESATQGLLDLLARNPAC